jgi:uncharacterized membrane protein YqjE
MAAVADPHPINPLDVVRILRSAGSVLLTQAGLHGQLVRLELAAEKDRIVKVLVAAVISFVAALCALLTAGALVLAFAWDTPYRVPAAIGVIVFYAVCSGLAWLRFRALSARGREAFAGTREELAADLAMIKSRL